jgi:hypothetical protein
MRVRFVGLGVLLCVSACAAQDVAVHGGNGVTLGAPPAVAVKAVTDTVGGRQLTDNYRWLEDQQAPNTRAYISAQMAYTGSYFAQIQPLKDAMVKRLTGATARRCCGCADGAAWEIFLQQTAGRGEPGVDLYARWIAR